MDIETTGILIGVLLATVIGVPIAIWSHHVRYGWSPSGQVGTGLTPRKNIAARRISEVQAADDVAIEGEVQVEQLIRPPVGPESVVGFQLFLKSGGPPTVISRFGPFQVVDGSGVALVSAGNDVELRGAKLRHKTPAKDADPGVLAELGITPKLGDRVALRCLLPGARVHVRGRARRQLAKDPASGYRDSPEQLCLESTEEWPLVIRVLQG